MPTKTPVWLSTSVLGASPARSQCLPAHLQQQPVLRIHAGSLTRGNAKEERVELLDALE